MLVSPLLLPLVTPTPLSRLATALYVCLLYVVFQYTAGLWSLDNITEPTTAAVIQDAIQNPDRFVLKPQREGGGNNLYGPELSAALQQGLAAGGDSLAAFILMQRIVPPPQRSVFVRGGAWGEDESLSELGIYGTFLRVGDEVGVRWRQKRGRVLTPNLVSYHNGYRVASACLQHCALFDGSTHHCMHAHDLSQLPHPACKLERCIMLRAGGDQRRGGAPRAHQDLIIQ